MILPKISATEWFHIDAVNMLVILTEVRISSCSWYSCSCIKKNKTHGLVKFGWVRQPIEVALLTSHCQVILG